MAVNQVWTLISNVLQGSLKKLFQVPAAYHHNHFPPTSDTARFHSYRVYFQVQAWLGEEMEPTEWDWDIQKTNYSSILKPHKMDQATAPH